MNDIFSKAISLSEFVQYQDGSVVSREIIKKDVGTITVFAFDKGQGLSEHTASFDAFISIIDGCADITISGTTQSVAQGNMIVLPANEPHSVYANEQFKMLLVMIKKL